MDYHMHSIQEKGLQTKGVIERATEISKLEERRRQEMKRLQEQEEFEFQSSASHFLRNKVDALDQRVENLEDVVSQLVIMLEKNTNEKINWS